MLIRATKRVAEPGAAVFKGHRRRARPSSLCRRTTGDPASVSSPWLTFRSGNDEAPARGHLGGLVSAAMVLGSRVWLADHRGRRPKSELLGDHNLGRLGLILPPTEG